MMNDLENSTETIRQAFKPNEIKVLFIGESAPASDKFFYKEDSLCGYTQEAFADVFPEVRRMTKREFLNFFKNKGCFLDDLCHVPVNKLQDDQKDQRRKQNVPLLANRIKEYKPTLIIIVMKEIAKLVRDAISQSGLHTIENYEIPFGGNGNQKRYKTELSNILHDLQNVGILN
jgi:hypothetical protein